MPDTATTAKPTIAGGDLPIEAAVARLPIKLIGSVTVQPSTIQPGQSVLVEVLDGNQKSYAAGSPVVVTINGVPAARRYMQFLGTGTYTLQIRAVSGSNSETATATFTVAGAPLTFRRSIEPPVVARVAKLTLGQTFSDHYVATFSLGVPIPAVKTASPAAQATAPTAVEAAVKPAATQPAQPLPKPQLTALSVTALDKALDALPAAALTVKPAESVTDKAGGTGAGQMAIASLASDLKVTPQSTSYKWNFGDGTTATTQTPSVTHDYFPAIQAGLVSHVFDVTCTAEHDNVTVTRTLVLNSAYGLCKNFGTLVPNIDSDVFATWHKGTGFSASMTIYNIEAEPITLTSTGVVALSDNPDAELPPPVFTTMKTPITIKAKSASAVGILISISQLASATKLGNAVPGFMVYYRGSYTEQGKTTPVLFSRTIRIPLNDSGGAWLTEAGTAPKLSPIAWDLVANSVFSVASDPKLKLASDKSAVSTDDATQTVAVSLDSMPQSVTAKSQARAAIQSGILAAISGAGA